MLVLLETASVNNQSFTIQEMTEKMIKIIGNKIPNSKPELFRKGIAEICRLTLNHEKIDTIGDKKAPRFITYPETNGLYYSGNKFLRIPFENAKLIQLKIVKSLKRRGEI